MTVRPALEGLRVVELTSHVRGRYCGRLFAELGAYVTRLVEPGVESDADSVWLDAGKHIETMPAATLPEVFPQLGDDVDVLIEDSTDRWTYFARINPPGVRDPLHRWPRMVRVIVTPFGLTGPWAGRDVPDLVISALSGIAGINGYADGVPLREPGPQAEMVGALMAFIGALTALEEREQSGQGQTVDASCMEAALNVLAPAVVQWSYTGSGPKRRERGADMLFRCADGWMSLYITANRAWETIVSVLGVDLEPGDDRFADEAGRRKNAKAMREVLEPVLLSKTRKELFELLSPMRVVCGMVMDPRELVEDEHLKARDAFVEVEGSDRRIPRIAIRSRGEKLSASLTPRVGILPIPGLGDGDVRSSLVAIAGRLPLEHIVIADLTQAWAGSYAMQLLADFGAKVIKIESRKRPDPWRGGFHGERGIQAYPTGGPGERPYNRMWLANSVNRNKLGITLDLENEECREIFLGLVRKSDVVAENFTPRVLPNFGLGYQRLKQEKPEIILLSMPGYGLDGPYSDYPAIGGTIEPMSGNSALLGEPGGLPQTSGLMYPDAVAGLHGAAAVLAALQRRARTGEGSHMELSQQESMLSMTAPFYVHDGWTAPVGNLPPAGGDDRIEQGEDGRWHAFSDDHEAEVRFIDDVMQCEHLAKVGYFVDVEQNDVGAQRMPGVAPRLSRTPGSVRTGAPGHGADSRRVLREMLALDDSTLDRLEADGLIGEGPPPGWHGP